MLLQLLKKSIRRPTPSTNAAGPTHAGFAIDEVLSAIDSNHLARAEALLRARLAAAPRDGEALHLLGVTMLQRGEPHEAIDILTQAARNAPETAEIFFNLGTAYGAAADYGESRAAFEQFVSRRSSSAAGWANLGSTCKVLGHLDAAEMALRRALEAEPGLGEAWHNLGSILADMGSERRQEAIAAFERAIALGHRGVLESRFSRALALLAVGDLERGWKEVDERLGLARWANDVRPYSIPFWRGEPLAGRSILVWGEQGVADEMLHASMYAQLAAQAAHCVIECRHKLIPLMARSFPGARIVPWRQPVDPLNASGIDYQIAAASLGRFFRPNLSSYPTHAEYLRADPQRVAFWRDRLDRLGTCPKIGFSWRSSDTSGERALACTNLEDWRPLFAAGDAKFICLQYDDCAVEIDSLRRSGQENVVRFADIDYFDDLDEVAALMKALDLVISAPTVVSVQAAALGIPTWQLAYGLDWQTLGTEANPWFPAMQRFERSWNETWADVMQRIVQRLGDLPHAVSPGIPP